MVPHIALEDTILADEVQNVRAFGSESMLEGVQAVVNQRMSEMATKMDATLEHLRIGAIKGQILDADGSAVIYDLFTEFGVTAAHRDRLRPGQRQPGCGCGDEEEPRHPAQDRGRSSVRSRMTTSMRCVARTSSTT